MTYEKAKRVQWHLGIAFCKTLLNIRVHIKLISFEDMQMLLSFFNCSIEALPKRFYTAVSKGWSAF